MSVFSTLNPGKAGVTFCAGISGTFLILFMGIFAFYSHDALIQIGGQIWTPEWHPPSGKYGMLPMLYGSVMVTMISLGIAVPLGLLTAVFTSEFLKPEYRLVIKTLLETLAGIPSIIYGLIGVAVFSLWVQHIFDLQTGRTVFTAGILLAMMILPTIITLSDDALRNVPEPYREAATGLGLYRHEVLIHAVLPIAAGDIVGAVLLALGRALGETMAVMLVIGSVDQLPPSLFQTLAPGQTITSKLGRELAEASFGSLHFSALVLMGGILFVLVLVLTGLAQWFLRHERRLHE